MVFGTQWEVLHYLLQYRLELDNRNVVRNLGVNYSFKKNVKSVETAVKAIKNGNRISKTLWEGFSSNLGGSTTAFVWGLIF